ncbi:proline iminopeptidase [Salinibacterium amurskyense]|uniref:Proline iminopeptidase n=1 Tax=Salinibacterium amurskyense TaxID=205941 RepID=A0A2M9D5L4_9MICO|nr:alpha/beta fold hydrolase [Salinibacterium amurskyense]PJJ81007.1 proline iminopeptidase [Salinibacterium amurskyense]RLQ83042.1 alpha/beta fold hydrolase [Salinibacterium amurskyense]
MFAPITPHSHGWLSRPDGARLFWEESGNPHGQAALYLHGGPGSGLGPGGYRRRFDPAAYRIIGLDQRGCGQSTPLAIDALDSLDSNTIQALIADLEALREHLGIDTWVVHGVSWGCTLALAYALQHPERVLGLVLVAVTTGAREEIEWITEGVGTIFPEAWAQFSAVAREGERPVDAYARLLRDGDPQVRADAARAWETWERTHISLDPHWAPGPLFDNDRDRENFATLVTHYWENDCFLGGALRICDRIAELEGIPATLIHGRRDISGPASTPWRLHQNWPSSELIVIEDEGHGGPRQMECAAAALSKLISSADHPASGQLP